MRTGDSSQETGDRGQRKVRRRERVDGALSLLAFCLLLTAYCLPTPAQYGRPPESRLPQGQRPQMLTDVRIDQKLDGQVPLDLAFRDETGREVRLREYFGSKPVVLSLVYYECPMLCNEVLNGLVRTLKALSFTPGKEFTVVTVSFDARETPALAAAKKRTYLNRYRREGADAGWHFLTGDQAAIDRLTEAVGFRYAFDAESNQFAHASAIMVVTPQGKLSHYFYGIEYAPRDLRLGLVEASAERIGSSVDQLLLYCYHYDPTTGKYGPVIMNIVRVAGVVTVIGILALILALRRRRKEPWKVSISRGGSV
jgi:protein SCO1/2